MNCFSDAEPALPLAALTFLSRLAVGAFVMLGAVLHYPALAGDYPSRTITFVVPFPPGGIVDSVARVVLPSAGESLGQATVIENRGGSGGNFAVAAVSRAAPDGYTLLMTANSPIVMNPFMYKSYPIDPEEGLTPIAMIGTGYMGLAVQASSPIKSVGDLIAVARQRPDELTFGHLGAGSAHYVLGALLNRKADIKVLPIPFQGAGPAIQALLGGHITMTYGTLSALTPYVDSGQFRLLAVAEPRRISEMPDVPAIAETVPGVMASTWVAVFGPPRLPEAIVDSVYKAMRAGMATGSVRQKLTEMGVAPALGGPRELKSVVRQDLTFWRDAIAAAGFSPQ